MQSSPPKKRKKERKRNSGEVAPEDVTELLQSHDRTLMEKLLLMDEQRKEFPEMKSPPGEVL